MIMTHGFSDEFTIVDKTANLLTGDVLLPFAYDEIQCRKVGQGLAPLIHLWRHQKAFVLGLRDRRLPNAEAAINWLKRQGYAVAVRNSGGAAVPLDPGVVNISAIIPNPLGRFEHRRDFELMYRVISETLAKMPCQVEKGEIIGSYCPGDYDLSIAGKKFCGIAQRRQTKAYAVQAFVVVEGSGRERAELAKQFYDIARGGAKDTDYPFVQPASMASLSELIGELSQAVFTDSVMDVLVQYGGVIASGQYGSEPSTDEVMTVVSELRERYDH